MEAFDEKILGSENWHKNSRWKMSEMDAVSETILVQKIKVKNSKMKIVAKDP